MPTPARASTTSPARESYGRPAAASQETSGRTARFPTCAPDWVSSTPPTRERLTFAVMRPRERQATLAVEIAADLALRPQGTSTLLGALGRLAVSSAPTACTVIAHVPGARVSSSPSWLAGTASRTGAPAFAG